MFAYLPKEISGASELQDVPVLSRRAIIERRYSLKEATRLIGATGHYGHGTRLPGRCTFTTK
jgi:hypothetical protein